jgi:hypothetical protein
MGKQHRRISTYPKYAILDYPTAHITINKSRIKTYPYNQIFMSDGQEFQIELNNYTQYVWLAMISVNGEKCSDSGLVLKPGEHVFLDTPDITSSGKKKHKFKFETYEIEQGRSHLVADNGKIEIEFYKKRQLPNWLIQPVTTHIYHHRDITPRPPFQPYGPFWYSTGGTADPNFSGTVTISNSSDNITFTNNCNAEINDCSEVSLGKSEKCSLPVPTEETCRIEKGSKSKQKFHKTNYDFESYASHTEEFQIFPISQRRVTIQEATREYCTQCGKRRKKNHTFCPKCGTRF